MPDFLAQPPRPMLPSDPGAGFDCGVEELNPNSEMELPQRTQRAQRELRRSGGSGKKLMLFSMLNQSALLCVLCVLCGSLRFSG